MARLKDAFQIEFEEGDDKEKLMEKLQKWADEHRDKLVLLNDENKNRMIIICSENLIEIYLQSLKEEVRRICDRLRSAKSRMIGL